MSEFLLHNNVSNLLDVLRATYNSLRHQLLVKMFIIFIIIIVVA